MSAAVFSFLVAVSAAAQSADLFVTKNAPTTAAVGSTFTYTITVGNGGPDDATSANLNDTLPGGIQYQSYTQTTGPTFTCSEPPVGSSGSFTCSIATLPAGGLAQFDIVVKVAPGTEGTTLINTATVSSETPDDNPENNTSITGTNVPGNNTGNLADLRISKTGPVSQPPDTDVTFTITLINDGPDDATTVSWKDTLPNSIPPSSPLTFVSFVQNSGPTFSCSAGSTTTCTLATFPAGSTATFTLVAHIPAGTSSGDTYTNVVNVTSDNDPNPDNDTSSTTVTVTSADVGVAKSGPSTAVAGGPTFDYIVTLSNSGPDAATDVSFSDTLPSGLTFVSVVQNTGPAATCTGGQLVACTIPLLGSPQSAQFTITVRPQSTIPNGTVLTNTATATSSSSDPNSNNNSSTVMTTVSANADVSIVKSGPATAVAGTNITYGVTVTNNGPATASNVNWTDTLPPNTTFVSESQTTGPAFTCTTGQTISCSIAALDPSASATFSITAQVALTAPNASTLSNTATVTSTTPDSTPGNNSSNVNTIVNANADLSILKTAPLLAIAGNNMTYSITVSNGGPAAAVNATMNDLLPPATTFVSLTQTSGPTFTCTTGQSVSCTIATLASGTSAAFDIVVKIAASTPNNTTLTNTATVLSPTSPDTNGTNNTSTTNTNVTTLADVSVAKTGPAAATAGSNVTYTIVVANAGPSDAASVTMTDVLPAGTTFVSESQTNGPVFTCTTGPTVTCSIATLAPNTSATFSLTVAFGGTLVNGTTVTNTATVTTTTPDSTPGNNTSSVPTLVSANADVSVTKTGPTSAMAGSNVTYTIVVANGGPSNAASVTLTDVLPAGTTFVSESQTNGPVFTCTTGPTVTCTIATLAPNTSATFSLTVAFSGSIVNGTTVTNTATVTTTTPDPTPGNNTSSAPTLVSANADLSVTKSGPTTTPSNTTITYTVTAANAGPANAATVSLTETVPTGMTFVSANQTSGPAFTCSGTGPVVCTIATFTAGASATFKFTFNVPLNTPVGASPSDTATITSSTPDPNLANNTASATTTVGASIPALSPLTLALLAMMLAAIGWMTARR